MSFDWKVAQVEYSFSEDGMADVVTTVHWTLSKEDEEGNGGYSYGSVSLPSPNPESFTPYADLTQDQVLGWLFNTATPMNPDDGTWQEEREANIDEQIYAKAHPDTGAGVPWAQLQTA